VIKIGHMLFLQKKSPATVVFVLAEGDILGKIETFIKLMDIC